MRIALVTALHVDPHLTDDVFLSDALAERGQGFDWRAWDDPSVPWQDYDRVVLRSCWGYHLQASRFETWLERLDALGVRLMNPSSMVRANIHKRYLLELAAAGVAIPPLRLVPQGSAPPLTDLQRDLDGGGLILKPAISGLAWRTLRVEEAGIPAAQPAFTALLAEQDVLVQTFVPEVQSLGEYSLIFFAGRYSHAVLKTPEAGEFRCQPEYGGSVMAITPPAAVLETAEQALRFFGKPPYGRVDLVISRGMPMVMEVELIEPVLFFSQAPAATARMVDVLTVQSIKPADKG